MSYQSIKVFEILSLSQKLKKRSLYWKRGWRRYTLLSAFVRLWFMMKLVSNVCPYLLLSFYPLSFPVQSSSLSRLQKHNNRNWPLLFSQFYFIQANHTKTSKCDGSPHQGLTSRTMYSMPCQLRFHQRRRYFGTGCSSSPNSFPRILENSTISENTQENMCIIAIAR